MRMWRKLLWLASLCGTLGALFLALSAGRGESVGTRAVTILSTAANNGEVAPCG